MYYFPVHTGRVSSILFREGAWRSWTRSMESSLEDRAVQFLRARLLVMSFFRWREWSLRARRRWRVAALADGAHRRAMCVLPPLWVAGFKCY